MRHKNSSLKMYDEKISNSILFLVSATYNVFIFEGLRNFLTKQSIENYMNLPVRNL